MTTSRIACLYVPDLPVQALVRADGDLAGRAVAVTDGTGARARVICASADARAAGVMPDLPPVLAGARSR